MASISKSQAREDEVLRRLLKTPPKPRPKVAPKQPKIPARKPRKAGRIPH